MKLVNLSDRIYFYNLSTIDSHLRAGIDVGRLFVKLYDGFSLLNSKLELLLVWMERSRQRQALLKLDDHLLADIGISRDQVNSESNKKFWQA